MKITVLERTNNLKRNFIHPSKKESLKKTHLCACPKPGPGALIRKFEQGWSTIPPISTNQAITHYFNSLNTTLELQVLAWDRHTNESSLNFHVICTTIHKID
jgi:hypothetical protein